MAQRRRSGDPPEKRKIINALADYFSRASGGRINDFGSSISECDVAVERLHVYRMTLQTLYERRRAVREEEPYSGQPLSPPLVWPVTDEHIWDCEFRTKPGFKSAVQTEVIEKTTGTAECTACKPNGLVDCQQCGGAGTVPCCLCMGTGQADCQRCSGKGYFTLYHREPGQRECFMCSGSTCAVCRGRGWITEQVSKPQHIPCQPKVICLACHGGGLRLCEACRQSGEVLCPACQGARNLRFWCKVERELKPATDTAMWPGRDSDEYEAIPFPVRDFLREAKGADEVYPVIATIESSIGKLSSSEVAKLPTVLHSVVRRVLKKANSRLSEKDVGFWKKRKPLLGRSHPLFGLAPPPRTNTPGSSPPVRASASRKGDRQIARQRLVVRQTSVYLVRYRYGDHTYTAWFFGDGHLIHLGNNPVGRRVESLIAEAESLWKNWNLAEAIRHVHSIRAIAEASERMSPPVGLGSCRWLNRSLPFWLRKAADMAAFFGIAKG